MCMNTHTHKNKHLPCLRVVRQRNQWSQCCKWFQGNQGRTERKQSNWSMPQQAAPQQRQSVCPGALHTGKRQTSIHGIIEREQTQDNNQSATKGMLSRIYMYMYMWPYLGKPIAQHKFQMSEYQYQCVAYSSLHTVVKFSSNAYPCTSTSASRKRWPSQCHPSTTLSCMSDT